MNITISGKQMDLTDAIKDSVAEKLERLDYYLHPETEVKVTVSAKKARQKVEVTIIPISGPIIRAEDTEENLYAAIDVVYDKLNTQLRKYKKEYKININQMKV
ncbi:ribosome hibernation-promoting factor, HPF/YfiA family [Paraclostridium sp. AKS81]|uniref:ribosome hibernation-promoting factor, HPF/YfiA family n=1 Tax=Paraclostridium sp. AKS81 TaxID=2876117 RepID=UPI002FCCFC2C